MKNKLIFFLSTISLLMFNTSCNDERLDILPLNILTSDQIFQSESGINAYLASLYSAMPYEDFNFLSVSADMSNQTDEAIAAYATQLSTIPDGTWYGWWGYNYIRNVNDFMDKLPTANISDEKINILKGEALFIRAFYYFGLAKRYGGVPIIKVVQEFTGDNLDELQVPRNKEQEVWDFIASDLDEAISLLPEKNIKGRINKYGALALKSRAMLYAASIAKYGSVQLNGIVGINSSEANKYWQASYDAADLVIKSLKYSLYEKNPDKELNFTQLFIETDNPEEMFSVYYNYPDKKHAYDAAFLPFGVRGTGGWGSNMGPTLEMVEQYEYIDGTPGTLKFTNPDDSPIFYAKATDLFINKDPRCLGTVIVPFSTYRGTVIDVQAGIYDQGVKWEAGDYKSLYNPTTHLPDNTNGTIHIVGFSGLGGQEVTQTGFYIRKYLDYNLDRVQASTRSTQRWMVFRFAEILLNYAEAAVELNKISDAKLATNLVRDRAGIKLLNDAEVTIDRVRHERLVEFACENHRWWDYRRWRISDKVMNNTMFSAIKPYFDLQANAYRFEKGDAGRWMKTFDIKVYYERIDPLEIAKNHSLIQNPGY
jgi:starch-binding outer membrane protein, SusD/RagB family